MASVFTDLSEMTRNCMMLTSEKARERKDACSAVQRLLSQQYIKHAIDDNTDNKRKSSLTWDLVFSKAKEFVLSEIEHLEILSSKRRGTEITKSTETSRATRVSSTLAFFSQVIKVADQRGPRLKILEVTSHVLFVLQSENLSKYLGKTYCQILVNSVLSVPKYRQQITKNYCQDLLDIFISFANEPPSWLSKDSSLVNNIIHLIISSSNCHLQNPKLFKFFAGIFKEARESMNFSNIENLLSALHCFSMSVAEDCRGQVCELGETIFPDLLTLWKKSGTMCKEHIIQFFQLQMSIHHPLGTHTDEEGAWSTDHDHWKKCLQKLYDAITNYIGHLESRLRAAGAKLDPDLKSSFLDLAADVFHQVFWVSSNYNTVQCFSNETGSSAAKRRRIDVGLHIVKEKLETTTEGPALIAWLQVLSTLFHKHPSCLSTTQCLPLLNALHQLQANCKRHEVGLNVLRCLQSFAVCYARIKTKLNKDVYNAMSCIWRKAWVSMLKTLSIKHLKEEGFSLLTVLIMNKLVEPDLDVWKVLLTIPPSKSSLEFLSVYMQFYPLPENCHPIQPLIQTSPSERGSYPFRHYLIDWLLPDVETGESNKGLLAILTSKSTRPISPRLLSEVITALCLRNMSTASFTESPIVSSRKPYHGYPFVKELYYLERLYLESSFDEDKIDTYYLEQPTAHITTTITGVQNISNSIQAVKKLILDRLTLLADQITEYFNVEGTGSSSKERLDHLGRRLQCFGRYCRLSSHVVGLLLENGTLDQSALRNIGILKKSGVLLKRMESSVTERILCNESEMASKIDVLKDVIEELQGIFHPDMASSQVLFPILSKMVPLQLLDDILQIYHGKWGQSMLGTTRLDVTDSSMILSQTGFMLSQDDNDDDDFDMEVSVSDADSTMHAAGTSSSQSTTKTGYISLRHSAAQFLCTLSSVQGDSDETSLKDSILEPFQEVDFDAKKETDLQMYFTVAHQLARTGGQLSVSDLEVIMTIFRQVMGVHRKHPEVCQQALQLLQDLAPHFKDTGEEAKVVYMIRAFWKLKEDYSPAVRLALVKCMETYLKVDPEGHWTSIGNTKDEFSLRKEFPRSILDENHAVRMYTGQAIGCLFMKSLQNGEKHALPKTLQYQTFEQVAKVLANLLLLPESISDDAREDEGVNRSVSMLSALKHLIIASPVCEKKAIGLIFQAFKEQLLDKEFVIKVLGQLSKKLGYQTSISYISFHLPYVIDNWLNHGFNIADFPFRILGYKTLEDFFKCHYNVVLPQIILRPAKIKASMEQLSTHIKPPGDYTTYISQSFCGILSCLLPWFAVQSRKEGHESGETRDTRRNDAHQSYEYLKQLLTQQVVDKTMASNFDELVLHLLYRMFEPSDEGSDLAAFTCDTDPDPNVPYFTSQAIKASLEYLTSCFKGESLVTVLCRTKDNIQKILLALNQQIFDTHLIYEKRRVLSMYRLFVLLILRELSGGLGNTWAFFIRDVIYSLRRIMTSSEEETTDPRTLCTGLVMDSDLFSPCCNLLYHVCQSAVQHCSEELNNHLSVIVSTMVPYAKKQDDKAQQALGLLSFLIIDSRHALNEAISQLDPFPDMPQFKEISDTQQSLMTRTTLLQEISHFVSISTPPLSRVEGLKHLRQRLINNKHKLHRLLKDNKGVIRNSVPDLVHELLHLSSCLNSVDTSTALEVKMEIANCLGEIGSVDFSTVALTGRQKQDPVVPAPNVFKSDPVAERNSAIVGQLNKFMTDKRVDVVAAASVCLKQVLNTPSGISLLKKYGDCKADRLLWYLEPFKPSRKKKSQTGSLPSFTQEQDFQTFIGNTSLWIPGSTNESTSHSSWVTCLTCALIESGAVQDDVLVLLSPVCKAKTEFADHVLPYLVHNILDTGDDEQRDVLTQQIQGFFNHCIDRSTISSRPSSPLLGMDGEPPQEVSKQSIRSMLNVVNYLRGQNRSKRGRGDTSTPWDNNFWLDLDYLVVAQAAQKCSAHFTALLYAEIWSDIQRAQADSQVNITLPSHSQDMRMDEHSHATDSGPGTNFQSLLLEIYSCIGEPDSLYGVGAGRLSDMESRIRTYEHEGHWGKALGGYDLQVQESATAQTGLIQALKNFGLYHVMHQYLHGLKGESLHRSEEIAELQYEAAWRTCLWDVDVESSSECSPVPGINHSIFTGLCALQDNELSLLDSTLQTAKLRLVSDVSHVSLESVRSVYPYLVRLQQLVELQYFAKYFNRTLTADSDFLSDCNERFPLPDTDFEFIEPILALRTSVLQTLVKVRCSQSMEGLTSIYKGLVGHLEVQAKVAREANNPQVSEKALFTIRQLQNDVNEAQSRDGVNIGVTWSWRVEEARLRWARDERQTAMHELKMLTKQLDKLQEENPEAAILYPLALGLYGSWLAETRSENPNKIIEDYLDKAANLLEDMEHESRDTELEAFLALARYADNQYENIVDYMNSAEFENKQERLRKAKDEIDRLQKLNPSEGDRYYRTLEVQSHLDEEELRLLHDNKMNFLYKALVNYIKTLQAGDKYDLRVFRLCSLWFDNANEDVVNTIIKESLARIQTRKFLPLMYQLAARLGTKSYKNNDFQRTLNELIERVSIDHPHHTMFILLALANADRDNDYIAGPKKSGRMSRNAPKKPRGFVDGARVQAACSVLDSISQHKGDLVQAMRSVCTAYIELAYQDVNHLKKETGPFNLPSHLKINQLVNVKHVPVPTMDIKIDPLCRYEDLVYISRISPTFCLAGGINLPKILTCIGSDGIHRRQLVKGRDDLRQDAVMEQVFSMVNQLLDKNAETRKRKLKIRTYKVIPLSQRSGMLEWCEGTTPLGDYLIGKIQNRIPGAHQKYYPKDWSPLECRRKMMQTDQSRKTKAEVYKEITDNFHPVFRHFFLEKFSDPAVWFEKRLAYVKSCATCSIVGYIVGLGDRHVQNILVDCNTAELIHIDLGVAFEQGKILRTPETVPFRLTRDLVDGMGVTGVEGVYRRCCEKTMDVMRSSKEALVTILEVLLYDPIYTWTLSPEKQKALQQTKLDADDTLTTGIPTGDFLEANSEGNTDEARNKMAERVLLRLKQKLNGVEDNVQLSVSGQVNHLIREAMDPNNLCRLFPGWQPWL